MFLQVCAQLVLDADAVIDQNRMSASGISVSTTDASGPRGGGWFLNQRSSFLFPLEDRQSLHHHAGATMVRSDNAAAVVALNRGYSSTCDLNVVTQLRLAEAASHGSTIAARHIPGMNNNLADILSRWKPEGPTAHRQLHPDLDDNIVLDVPRHQVDACTDPCGSNSLCTVFWLPLQDGPKESWQARHIWCHPPVGMTDNRILTARPICMSATFVFPAWPFNRLWQHVKGGYLLRRWPAGTHLGSGEICISIQFGYYSYFTMGCGGA